jgi:glucose/arabinose dehydrogenase
MRRSGIAVVVAACSLALAVGSPASAAIDGHRVVRGLRDAVAFTFDGRDRIWYVEKTRGEVWVTRASAGRGHRVWTIPHVDGSFAQGPLGIAVHPRFPDVPFVYVYATRGIDGRLVDQLLRLRVRDGRVRAARVLLSIGARPGALHDGGRILFAPDGKLWVTTGDAGDERAAQDRRSLRGKVLRVRPDGSVPPDDPGRGSRVWARGFRNPWGLDFDPRGGRPWLTDNGPDCNDELNRVRRARNHGWGPSWTCRGRSPRNTNRDGPRPVQPVRWWSPPTAPTGVAFCDGCGLGPRSDGALFVGEYNTRAVRRVILTRDRLGVRSQATVFRANGRVLSLEADGRGRIYLTTGRAIVRLCGRADLAVTLSRHSGSSLRQLEPRGSLRRRALQLLRRALLLDAVLRLLPDVPILRALVFGVRHASPPVRPAEPTPGRRQRAAALTGSPPGLRGSRGRRTADRRGRSRTGGRRSRAR